MTVVGRKYLIPFTNDFSRSSEAVKAWLSIMEMDAISRIEEACEWLNVAARNERYALFQIGNGNDQVWISASHCRNTLMILKVGTQSDLKTMEASCGLQITIRSS